MSVFKCKMCGGALEIGSMSVATCAYCGTQQTLPRLDDDRRAELYDRANHYRRNNEFDKAASLFENMLNEGASDAEVYWSLVLCRYGVEYVEDPATGRRIPTVNRAQFTSIYDDENYRRALQLADPQQQRLYEQEAYVINDIQRGILSISSQETPFDVFICYKETDDHGHRTQDSLLAQELYQHLSQEGLKVFFSRITLEDKLGTAYEPYIFAALNSAKVMVVLGTRPSYLNAPWVKNEWSRYLSLIRSGAPKTLIPAYRDMDPYHLPEEFSHLQAQDLSKLGCMQDLVYGIKKIIGIRIPTSFSTPDPRPDKAALLKRAALFLNDKQWRSANAYCEKVLDIDPECAEAYLYKLMADLQIPDMVQLSRYPGPISNNPNYNKVLIFADQTLKAQILSVAQSGQYHLGAQLMAEGHYDQAHQIFVALGDFRDSKARAAVCVQWIETLRQQAVHARVQAQKQEAVQLEHSVQKLYRISSIFSYCILFLLFLPFFLTDLRKDNSFLFIMPIILLVPMAIAYIPIAIIYRVKARKTVRQMQPDMRVYKVLALLLPAAYYFARFLEHESWYGSYYGSMQAVYFLIALPLTLFFSLIADAKHTISSKPLLLSFGLFLSQLVTLGLPMHISALVGTLVAVVLCLLLYWLQGKWDKLSFPPEKLKRALCVLLLPLALFSFLSIRTATNTRKIKESLEDNNYIGSHDTYYVVTYAFEEDGYYTAIFADGSKYGPRAPTIHCSYLSRHRAFFNGYIIAFGEDGDITALASRDDDYLYIRSDLIEN